MSELAAIKVRISSKLEGGCLYPDFNSLAVVQASGMDWSNYVGQWYYDNVCGHAEVDGESPEGYWFGMLLIPEIFADQAEAAFPSDITRLTGVQAETFYNDRHAADFPDEDFDVSILEGIKLKQDLSLPLTANQISAIDPLTDTPGIRKNKKKLWTDYSVNKDITIKAAVEL